MREIKFRAWNKEKKEMFLNVMVTTPNNRSTVFNLNREIATVNEYFSLMQYTGLKDKNGKDVFEGDIVKCSGRGCPHEVIWMQSVPSSNISGMPGFYLKGLNEGYGWSFLYGIDEEVIGNIYENPELLKV